MSGNATVKQLEKERDILLWEIRKVRGKLDEYLAFVGLLEGQDFVKAQEKICALQSNLKDLDKDRLNVLNALAEAAAETPRPLSDVFFFDVKMSGDTGYATLWEKRDGKKVMLCFFNLRKGKTEKGVPIINFVDDEERPTCHTFTVSRKLSFVMDEREAAVIRGWFPTYDDRIYNQKLNPTEAYKSGDQIPQHLNQRQQEALGMRQFVARSEWTEAGWKINVDEGFSG